MNACRNGDICPDCGHRTLTFFARCSPTKALYRCIRKYRCNALVERDHPKPLKKEAPVQPAARAAA